MAENSQVVERQKVLDHLNHIILTQSRLAEANFDVDGFMNLVVQQMEKLTPATGVVIELVEGDEMVYRAASGTVANYLGLRLSREGSISGLCVKTRQILHSHDTEKDSRVNVEACRLVSARSLIVAPLFHQGNAVGVLKILANQPNIFTENDLQTLQLMAGLIGSALAHQMFYDTTQKLLQEKSKALEELKKAEEKLKYMAHYDFLTDLPNRSLFLDRLETAFHRMQRHKKICALLFLDIDHFKNINDTLGHSIGDELLKVFASRLKQCIRKMDTAARLGGDEFIILLEELPDRNQAIAIAQKIIEKITESCSFQGKSLQINTSIGITYFADDKISADELIKQADNALYAAKQAGRNTFKIFE